MPPHPSREDELVSSGPPDRDNDPAAFSNAVAQVRAGTAAAEAASALQRRLSPDERLSLLDGDEPFWPGLTTMMTEGYNLRPIVAGAVGRLGIPGIRFSDGPRGVVMGSSTCFPVSMARGATWDPELEQRVGDVIGREVRAHGGNFFAGVCINVLHHPAWGRAQETYGEEPVLLGMMGAALTRGAQRHVMACVKHFACNSMENARFAVDVTVDERALHEIYLPHFRHVIDDADVASVMSAYNAVNGEWCGQNHTLLTTILRDEWVFEGFVISDFVFGLRDAVGSLRSGLDVEMPFAQQRAQHLSDALAADPSLTEYVDRSVHRILTTQLRWAAAVDDSAPDPSIIASRAHLELAREVATRAIVLLQNQPVDGAPVLPLDPAALRRVAVLGRLADVPNTGDEGSSHVRSPRVVTPLAGIRAALPNAQIVHDTGADAAAASATAQDADVAVVVVGYTAEDEGEYLGELDASLTALFPPPEPGYPPLPPGATLSGDTQSIGGDRDSLSLRSDDVQLVTAVASANPRTVVAIMAGSAVVVERWRDTVPAILMLWYPGSEGGRALADVLLGRPGPTGRLPFAIPTDEAHLPAFDKTARSVTYDLWHGQRWLDRAGVAPAFPLGFGLSYTTFALSDLHVETDGRTLRLAVTVRNTGDHDGSHVVQIYGGPADAAIERPARVLLGFQRVDLGPGEDARLRLAVSTSPLTRRDIDSSSQVLDPGTYRIEAGSHAGDPDALTATIPLA